MKNRRTITFNIGDENRIVVEDINKDIIKSSIFSEPYHYILNALDHYFDALPDNRDDYLRVMIYGEIMSLHSLVREVLERLRVCALLCICLKTLVVPNWIIRF